MCSSASRVSGPEAQGDEVPGSKLHRNLPWAGGDVCEIYLSRSMQGFGFPLAIHIPTDRQTNICMRIFIEREMFAKLPLSLRSRGKYRGQGLS